jgi:hypothetical protein
MKERIFPLQRSDAESALNCAIKISPNGFVQQEFSNIFNEMVKDGLTWHKITLNMVQYIHDGLASNNWPKPTLPPGSGPGIAGTSEIKTNEQPDG